MPRKPGERQFGLDFNAPPKEVVRAEPIAPIAKSDGVLFDAVRAQSKATPEQIETSNLRTFYNYLKNLNLTEKEINGLNILDVGASLGGFGDVAAKFGAHVISIDESRPANAGDIIEGDSKKLFQLSAEKMNLAERLNLKEEPKFDLVVSHFSTPYVFVNTEQDRRGKWKSNKTPIEWRLEMETRIYASLENIYKHLKPGGKAILYPLFLNLGLEEQSAVDFGNGEKRDVREFNRVIHEIINNMYKQFAPEFDLTFEPVPQKDGSDYTRLTIYRRDFK